MYFLYSAVLVLACLLSAPLWLVAMLRHGKYRAGLGERLGRVSRHLVAVTPTTSSEAGPCFWIHAVSVGEVLAVNGLIQELRRRFPQGRVFISTTTATGQKLARARFGEDNVFFFPLDFAFAIRPYLEAVRPELVVIAETEFWPNFLRLARESGALIAVVNARISDRSFPRYRRFRRLLSRVLGQVDLFLAQSQEDARRLVAIGAPAERVQISGNLKFDLKPPLEAAIVARLRAALIPTHASPVIVAGSTVEGEEPLVVEAFRLVLQQLPTAALVLAPRHPERFAGVAELLASSGLDFRRRSQWSEGDSLAGGVFLLDSIGELGAVYALADVAFVGGSLVARGGHNILEPAVHGVPVIAGPYTGNFRDIVALFRAANALTVVADSGALAAALIHLTLSASDCQAMAARANGVLQQHAGATSRTADELEKLLTARMKSKGQRQPVAR